MRDGWVALTAGGLLLALVVFVSVSWSAADSRGSSRARPSVAATARPTNPGPPSSAATTGPGLLSRGSQDPTLDLSLDELRNRFNADGQGSKLRIPTFVCAEKNRPRCSATIGNNMLGLVATVSGTKLGKLEILVGPTEDTAQSRMLTVLGLNFLIHAVQPSMEASTRSILMQALLPEEQEEWDVRQPVLNVNYRSLKKDGVPTIISIEPGR